MVAREHILFTLLEFPSFAGVKDVLMSIPKSDLLGVTMAVIHVAEQQFLAVYCVNSRGNRPYSCEIRVFKSVMAKMATIHQDILNLFSGEINYPSFC